jgi:hypothetical protein
MSACKVSTCRLVFLKHAGMYSVSVPLAVVLAQIINERDSFVDKDRNCPYFWNGGYHHGHANLLALKHQKS